MPDGWVNSPRHVLSVAIGGGLLGGVAIWLAITSADGSVRPWLVIALAITCCVLAAMIALLAGRRWGAAQHPILAAHAPIRSAPTDRERGGLESFERRLGKAMEDPRRFDTVLRPQLRELAEERLRAHFGVDSRTDPNRAHDLLGDSLWHLITTPVTLLPTRPELESWIRAIEAL